MGKKIKNAENLEDTVVGLIRGAVIGGVIMYITQLPLLGLVAFIIGATRIPNFKKNSTKTTEGLSDNKIKKTKSR